MSTLDIWGGQLLRDSVDGWVLQDMGAISCLYFSIHESRQDTTKSLNP